MATLKNVTVNDTGFVKVSTGSTAQRPGAPVVGMMRFNTTTSLMEVYTSAGWQSSTNDQVATGGSIVTTGGYTIHTFTSAGTFTPTYSGPVETLIVAAGGAGAAGIGGGGGGGGLIFATGVAVNAGQAYPIAVGGTTPGPGTGHGPAGSQGAPSSAFGITATGGGGGCGYYSNPGPGAGAGGSGGGGPGYGYATGYRPGALGVSGQGHPGGYGWHGSGAAHDSYSGTTHAGGGGGGAGEPGYNRQGTDINTAGAGGFPYNNGPAQRWDISNRGQASGGNGTAYTISGSENHYSGGGGGGTHGQYGYGANNGGLGGGGHCNGYGPASGTAATYYGGGGGAGSHPDPSPGGSGFQGIVIVRYRNK